MSERQKKELSEVNVDTRHIGSSISSQCEVGYHEAANVKYTVTMRVLHDGYLSSCERHSGAF